MKIGDYDLRSTGEVLENIEGKTSSGESSVGRFFLYQITKPDELFFELGFVHWRNGERDVRPTHSEGQSVLDHISSGRRRLTLKPVNPDEYYSVLRQARVKFDAPNEWSGLFKATVDELNNGCGIDVFAILLEFGALKVGTKQEVTGIYDRQRTWPTALFSAGDVLCPVIAFAVTRVLPLLRGYNPQLRLLK